MEPRRFLPGATYLITRRCSGRQFLLRPEDKVNRAVLYCLAYAAAKTGVAIHGFVILSNHYHLVLTDPSNQCAEFLQRFNLLVARCLNALRGRFGSLFDCSGPNCVRAVESADVIRQLVYTYCNPVSSGLVPAASDWPGLRSEPRQFGATISAERPGWFFSDLMPDEVSLQLTPPPCFAGREREEFVAELEEEIAEREADYRAEVARKGPGFLGARRVRNQSPTDAPVSYEKKWKLSPNIQAKRPEPRIEEIRALISFRKRYRAALERYRSGVKDVVFPAGTYWMRVFHLQKCDPPVSGAVPAAP